MNRSESDHVTGQKWASRVYCDRPKSSKLLTGYFCLSEERPSWKSAQQCIASAANRSFSGDGMLSVFFRRRHSNIVVFVVYPSAPV
jgi:hypothetical protein